MTYLINRVFMGPNGDLKNILAFFVEIWHHAIYGHNYPKEVFFVYIVVENYIAFMQCR